MALAATGSSGGSPVWSKAWSLDNGGTVGESLAKRSLAGAAIKGGELVDPRPLGPALKAVMAAMLDESAVAAGGRGDKSRGLSMPLLDGAKHVAVTMGSAGLLLASARPVSNSEERADAEGGGNLLEVLSGSGRWFSLSARHYPALSLGRSGNGAVADCTGAGDCLVAGMVGGLALGWDAHESACLGLVRTVLRRFLFLFLSSFRCNDVSCVGFGGASPE